MKPILVPTQCVHDWQQRLADPELHWEQGYSARTLAASWEDAEGLPPEITTLVEALGTVELLLAIPEYAVPLPGGARASQNDVFALARTAEGLVVLMVEGKVDESFDKTLEEWQKDASPGKKERLSFLKTKLGLSGDLPPGVRYQLLHRTASAVIEAERFHARDAALIVHAFNADGPNQASLDDYQAFLGLFGKVGDPGQLVQLGTPNGFRLWAGWAQGDPRFLKA